MDEQERLKYIRLRNKLNDINTNIKVLENKSNELKSLLNKSFTINNQIPEQDSFNEITNEIKNSKESINNIISICNIKI